MQKTLQLTLHRRFFADIASGTKHIEYRKHTRYWKERLENRDYDVIRFCNGYSTTAPEMLVEFRGVRKGRRKYEVLLGRVLQIKRWKPPKPSENQIARALKYIDSMEWTFARSMPQWPHWYVVGNRHNAYEFRFVGRLIWDFGYADTWGNRTNWYLTIGNFKYWFEGYVLNRAAPMWNAEFRRRGLRYAARHGKRIGPWGRLVSVKKKRRKR